MSDSDSEDENIIKYGTPLEPYEEDEIPTKRKFQQAPDQYAVDEHGRRRFHGAFTGGFSAGFGNTVGTPEGWTPSNFRSSRSEKAARTSQRPEDFMDEEDRGEFGIAPKQLQTHNEFSGQKRPHQPLFQDGPIPGVPVLQELIRPVHVTAAVKMLHAMGWKEGQGIGERVTSKDKKKAKDQHKVYGCYIPEEFRQTQHDQESSSSDSEIDFETLFAPDDYEPYILHRKNDRFGLGYSGLSRHSVLGNMVGEYGSEATSSRLVMKDKGRKVNIRGQAFGVGAFEADDEDIYAREDMSHYDFAIGGPAKEKEKKITKNISGNVLLGFIKATKPLPTPPSYPPPALPRDYVPVAAGARRSRFEPTAHAPRDQGLGRHELTAEARGALLGERPPTEQTPTITPPKNSTTAIQPIDFTTLNEPKKQEIDFISIKSSGNPVPKVFKPFASDLAKQSRYEKYLENRVEEREGVDNLSQWERERELVEFEQAAKLYKPLSGIMGDRFTHASEPDDALNPLCVVAKSSINHGAATKEQIEAAQSGMYGVMTRTELIWRPETLVCKRFNVPEVGGRPEQKSEDKPKVSYSIFSYLESSVHDKDSFTKEQTKFSGSKSLNTPKPSQNIPKDSKTTEETTHIRQNDIKISAEQDNTQGFSKRLTVAELFLKESEKSKQQGAEVTETINKFDKMDLYKSIFLSDTEDEDENDVKITDIDIKDFTEVPKNVERNTSPPRGIFANVNFDELNSWRRNNSKTDDANKNANTVKTVDGTVKTVNNNVRVEEGISNNDVYGPKIPENLQKRLENTTNNMESVKIDSSSEDSWVDVNELKSKKNKKKKSKNKKHKSKHKKKSKSKKKDR